MRNLSRQRPALHDTVEGVIAKYAGVFSIGLQNTFVYRWNFLIRSLFGLIPLAATIFIWREMFASRGAEIGGFDFPQMISYFVVVLIVDNLVTPTDDEWQIANDIRNGQINTFLSRPVNYLAYRGCLFLSGRLLSSLVTIVPIAAVVIALRDFVSLPEHPETWAFSLVALVLAAALQFLIAFTLAMFAFWILEISTVVFILYSFEYYLSGRMFPLAIMPDWLQGLMKILPFTYELYFPVAVFMEKIRGVDLAVGFAIQAVWVAVFFLLAVGMWRSGLRRYESVGG